MDTSYDNEIRKAAYMHVKSHEAPTVEAMSAIDKEKRSYMHYIAEYYNKPHEHVLKDVGVAWESMWEEHCKSQKEKKERMEWQKLIKELERCT